MATIFYFHGFGSTPNSEKVTALQNAFPEHDIIAPVMPLDPHDCMREIHSQVLALTNFPVIFVGTSLGGFWANHFAQVFDAPGVLINPSVHPSVALTPRIGVDIHNFDTGELLDPITEEMVQRYKAVEDVTNKHYNGALVSLYGANDDDVININETIRELKYFSHIHITDTGGHRFNEHFDEVIAHIRQLIENKG